MTHVTKTLGRASPITSICNWRLGRRAGFFPSFSWERTHPACSGLSGERRFHASNAGANGARDAGY